MNKLQNRVNVILHSPPLACEQQQESLDQQDRWRKRLPHFLLTTEIRQIAREAGFNTRYCHSAA